MWKTTSTNLGFNGRRNEAETPEREADLGGGKEKCDGVLPRERNGKRTQKRSNLFPSRREGDGKVDERKFYE